VVAPSRAFFDTSVLLGGLIELGPASDSAQKTMAAITAGHVRRPHTAWHCCLEFYFEVRQLPDDHQRSFLHAAADDRLVGGRIYDAHIAEIARVARVPVVVTDNLRHFAGLRRQGVDVVTAAQFAETITAT
jgi:predicted nucleic acid-binding protein